MTDSIPRSRNPGNLLSRRSMLRMSGQGIGTLALTTLLHSEGLLAATGDATGPRGPNLDPRSSHFPARANAVIMFMQNGGPGQMELFDPKPRLNQQDGKTYERPVETFQPGNSDKLLRSPFKFHHRGQCGMELSEIIPQIGTVADDICLVRSMVSEHNNHTEALVLLNTGKIFQGRPAMGSWISYALGTENQNLPAYIVLRDPAGYNTSGTLLWENGWLPALYGGTEVNTKGTPILNMQSQVTLPVQQRNLQYLAKLNQRHLEQFPDESELETRIRNFELAARMQLSAGDTLDLSRETQETQQLYGLENPTTAAYGLRCLMARRLVESGVRFVQIFPPAGQPWDSHGNVKTQNESICAITDLPSAALIKDLKQRGLLDSTLVIWTGEFGRLPVSQNGTGRDHNRNAGSFFLAGAGFKRGFVYGKTDDVGYSAVENPVTMHDLHATILHQLGLDHDRLTYRHHGIEESLTDSRVTGARIVNDLLIQPPV
jgi:hypothetical protein